MKKFILILAISCSHSLLFSQMKKDNYKVIATKYVHSFFEKFNQADTTILNYFSENCYLTSTGTKGFQSSKPYSLISELEQLKGRYKEEISNITISGDFHTMVVSMDYVFYFDNEVHHCGKNFFTLSKNMEKPLTYQIVNLADSRTGCSENSVRIDSLKAKLDKKMLEWHKAAGESDFEGYFTTMDSNFVYLGTDPGERWTKQEFASFCKPHFAKKNGWDFKTKWRNWYVSVDENTMWFEELLDTHMGECRGSGVWNFVNGEWKISQYNLALTIYNDKMEAVKKVNIK